MKFRVNIIGSGPKTSRSSVMTLSGVKKVVRKMKELGKVQRLRHPVSGYEVEAFRLTIYKVKAV